CAETAEQIERRLQRVRLVELEARHHVSGAHRSLRFSTAPLPFSSMTGPGPMLSLYLDPFSPAQAGVTCSGRWDWLRPLSTLTMWLGVTGMRLNACAPRAPVVGQSRAGDPVPMAGPPTPLVPC